MIDLHTMPSDVLCKALAASGVDALKLKDGREWVRAEYLGDIDQIGVKDDREPELMLFLTTQTDERSRLLVVLGAVPQEQFNKTAFLIELAAWVRERLISARPIPASVHYHWKPRSQVA